MLVKALLAANLRSCTNLFQNETSITRMSLVALEEVHPNLLVRHHVIVQLLVCLLAVFALVFLESAEFVQG